MQVSSNEEDMYSVVTPQSYSSENRTRSTARLAEDGSSGSKTVFQRLFKYIRKQFKEETGESNYTAF